MLGKVISSEISHLSKMKCNVIYFTTSLQYPVGNIFFYDFQIFIVLYLVLIEFCWMFSFMFLKNIIHVSSLYRLLYDQKNFNNVKHKCWLLGLRVSRNTHETRCCTHTWPLRIYNTPVSPVTSTCVSQCRSSFGSTIHSLHVVNKISWSTDIARLSKLVSFDFIQNYHSPH